MIPFSSYVAEFVLAALLAVPNSFLFTDEVPPPNKHTTPTKKPIQQIQQPIQRPVQGGHDSPPVWGSSGSSSNAQGQSQNIANGFFVGVVCLLGGGFLFEIGGGRL